MSFAQRINLVFLDLTCIIAAGLNHLIELYKTICPNLIQVKPLNRSAAALNHLLKLH